MATFQKCSIYLPKNFWFGKLVKMSHWFKKVLFRQLGKNVVPVLEEKCNISHITETSAVLQRNVICTSSKEISPRAAREIPCWRHGMDAFLLLERKHGFCCMAGILYTGSKSHDIIFGTRQIYRRDEAVYN